MTSTGNTAQKNLIDKLIKNTNTEQQKKAINEAIQAAKSGEEIKTLKAIAKKFNIEV